MRTYQIRIGTLFGFFALLLSISGSVMAQAKNEMLLYCGITMVRPMAEIAQVFEKKERIKITIAQGGSEDLYQSAKKSGLGDWYLPGEPSYRDKHFAEGLMGDHVVVGYNQLAMIVQKGNPKQIKPNPNELLRKNLISVIGNAESGSVGKETKDVLDQIKIYPQAIKAAGFLVPDSRSLMTAMRNGEADIALSWRATGFFPENAEKLDVIDLDPKLAKPQALLLIQLKSSKNAEFGKRFMAFVAGDEGQAIFRKHGFLDNKLTVK